MSEDRESATEAPVPGAEPSQEKPGRRTTPAVLAGCLVLVAIAVIIGLLLLRSCGGRGSTSSVQSSQPSPSAPAPSAQALRIEEQVYAALRAQSLPNGAPLTAFVYIARVSTDAGVLVTLTLAEPKAVLAKNPQTNPFKVAAACSNAVLDAIPIVTGVKVVDANNVTVSSERRP
jgi:hypothetical protein